MRSTPVYWFAVAATAVTLVFSSAHAFDAPVRVIANGYQPAPSRDGLWIAFRSGSNVRKAHPDGSGEVVVGEGNDPNWNFGGVLILATDYAYNLFSLNAVTGERTPIWTGSGSRAVDHPAWSPAGDEIAVSAPALTLVRYPSGPAAEVACAACRNMENSTWSPDGQWIAFDAGGGIYRVPRTGGVAVRVTPDSVAGIHPAWSPDGRFIAYARQSPGSGEAHIEVVDVRGAAYGSTPITDGPYNDLHPAWSPDGSTIYFESDRDGLGSLGIWKVAFDAATESKRVSWGSLKGRYR